MLVVVRSRGTYKEVLWVGWVTVVLARGRLMGRDGRILAGKTRRWRGSAAYNTSQGHTRATQADTRPPAGHTLT